MEKELIRQAMKLALMEEEAARQKQMEEEMEKWKREKEAKLAVLEAEAEAEEEEEEEEEDPLLYRRGGTLAGTEEKKEKRGESSSGFASPEKTERAVEWVASFFLATDREVELIVPKAEREAVEKELEQEESPMCRKAREHEEQLEWQLRLTREKKRRLEMADRMETELRVAEERLGKIGKNIEEGKKIDTLTQSMTIVQTTQQL
ncbi:hypothetical protein CBR_g18667 [Chara braunii]|uniref:Uncharacterized protein n=1 Tax=Chara braunii TaxID=69332 RepID=A0A388JTF7_CHABU|nr:hypothetical protein CBR_g18667 [Chara braunii]|eukprot:GBG61075.1 hypothetical protein CBR_g18667 [Chara braunii]